MIRLSRMGPPRLTFSASPLPSSSPSSSHFNPRLGCLTLQRDDATKSTIKIATPGLLTTASRGFIPHLSRDHVNSTAAIRWVNIPFETFLERVPPVPTTLKDSLHPLHDFFKYDTSKHIVCLQARDPIDSRDMPSNGRDHLSVRCIRGVRKLRISDWNFYASSTYPDVVVALSDIPFTPPPHSQKRINKSLERSTQWLLDSLSPVPPNPEDRPNLLVHLVGGINPSARQAFSQALTETLFGAEAHRVKPLKNLDDAITGYTFDLVPLRKALKWDTAADNTLVHLIQTSLESLPFGKPRIVNSVRGPQDILRLISATGVDLFDSQWAVELATFGVALDFTFPVPSSPTGPPLTRIRDNGKTDIGHNLYDGKYATDFNRLSTLFLDGQSKSSTPTPTSVTATKQRWCPCAACSPVSPLIQLKHSQTDEHVPDPSIPLEYRPAYTRAYIHHLLHTHEMSAHALLTMHNLSVVDHFFADILDTLERDGVDKFVQEVRKFRDWYDDDVVGDDTEDLGEAGEVEVAGGILGREAKSDWVSVDKARGKGRLAREKEKTGTAVLEEAEVV
ncbi:tRNA-guanine transglycosylase [Thelephora ganbajun]|uniref:tRNA-guanine transglycosylase n=1 Tax=Thelephora ganbajun TaxID=370292 RepID=A0ACB6ZA72_THEGA|nr:tRNA-guanine transglycosylase [Thelephora ganbajun]